MGKQVKEKKNKASSKQITKKIAKESPLIELVKG
jgi:hypothetical protein